MQDASALPSSDVAGIRSSTGAATDAARVQRFQELLRIPTVSKLDAATTEWAEFDRFVAAIPELYPALHSALALEVAAERTLLYRWRGRSAGAPTVLMAHYDVVAADDEGWTRPPFAAEVVGDDPATATLYGRGTLDDKGALVAILEAVEDLVTAGFVPEHDVYLSFGHDEEIAGVGAAAVVRLLDERGIRPALVLDEGGAVVEEGIVRGVDRRLAVIGVTEKGITTLALTVDQPGGHASTPPRLTATARLARAITRLTRSPFPARLSPAVRAFVSTIAEHATGPRRILFRSVRWTAPLIARLFATLSDETRAMVSTTAAVTQLKGSDGANVLPERASALVNIRIAVGSSVDEVVRHVRRAIRDDGVRIEVLHPSEPSPVSPSTGPAWDALARAILAVHPDVVPTPYTMLAASDSRHFTAISDHVYRFTPFEILAEGRATLHARNEHLRVASWLGGIAFYRHLLEGR